MPTSAIFYAGLTIETVSRTFTKLRTLGLIELPLSSYTPMSAFLSSGLPLPQTNWAA